MVQGLRFRVAGLGFRKALGRKDKIRLNPEPSGLQLLPRFVNFEEHWHCKQFLQSLRTTANQRQLLEPLGCGRVGVV